MYLLQGFQETRLLFPGCDIYPYINIPVVTIVWSYNGLPPQEMEGRIVTYASAPLPRP